MKGTCSVDGCPSPVKATGLCSLHYGRRWRTGDVGQLGPIYRPGALCAIEGCTRRHQARGWCVMHYNRWRTTGDPLLGRPVGVNVQPRSDLEPKTWRAVHHRLRSRRGRAAEQPCAHCGGAARDWAYNHTDPSEVIDDAMGMVYSKDLMRYVPLCPPCHRRFDVLHGARATITEAAIMRLQQKTIETLLARIETLEAAIKAQCSEAA